LKPSKKSIRKSRNKIFAGLAFLLFSSVISAVVAFAYYFAVYPSAKNAARAISSQVAGEQTSVIQQPTLKPGSAMLSEPKVQAGVLIDADSGTVLWAKDAESPRSIASLTKLVTAATFLQFQAKLDTVYRVPNDFNADGQELVEPGDAISALKLPAGERITYKDLLYTALIGSANNSAIALGRLISGGSEILAEKLTAFARKSGARFADLYEPSGLDPRNKASALDLAILAHVAFQDSNISQASKLPVYNFRSLNGSSFRSVNTNKLLNHTDFEILGAKTGYLQEAGYNLAIEAERQGHRLVLVFLGSPSSAERFANAEALLKWAFSAFVWETQNT